MFANAVPLPKITAWELRLFLLELAEFGRIGSVIVGRVDSACPSLACPSLACPLTAQLFLAHVGQTYYILQGLGLEHPYSICYLELKPAHEGAN